MSDFDFSDWLDKPLTDDESTDELLEQPYCKEHDVFDCWFAHNETPTAVETPAPAKEIDPREQQLNELMAKVSELADSVKKYDVEFINPLSERMTNINNQKQDAKKVYMELVAELDKNYSESWTQLRDARNKKTELQRELDRIQREQQNLLKSMQTEKMLKDIEDKLDSIILDSPWGLSARKYQLIDLKYMVAAFESGKTGVLNANDMGLGKTFESIMLDYCLQELFPAKYNRMPLVLWVTTPSLIKQTVREIKRWNPGRRVIPIEGSWNAQAREFATRMAIEELAIVVCNYEQLNTNKILMNTEWDIIFADEVSKLKGGANAGKPTKVWQNFKQLLWETKPDRYGIPQYTDPYDPVPRAKFFVPLSGTPIQNKPGDMWAYLHLFKPISFPRLKNFEREYAYGWPDIKVNFERLINVMSDQVIRRSKTDELDLPEKVYEIREVELSGQQKKIYDSMKKEFFAFLDSKGEQQISASVVIAWIIRLWEIALFPGIIKTYDAEMNEIPTECQESAVLDEAEDLIEEIVGAEEKTVVFSAQFNAPLHELQRRLNAKGIKSALYTGNENTQQRDDAVVGFQEGDVQVLLCNMKAAGYGLNLQKAQQAIFLDSWWNFAVNQQAEDRLHRMGQEGTVVIHKIQVVDSVYEFIASKAAEKEEMATDIMESRELRKSSDWKDYLEGMI